MRQPMRAPKSSTRCEFNRFESGTVGTGLGPSWIKVLTLLFLMALLARFFVMVDRRKFAPLTYVLVMLCFWLFGASFGHEAAKTQENWRVVEVEGDETDYVVVNVRGDQLIVAPLIDSEKGVYEPRFIHIDPTAEGVSESVKAIGPISAKKRSGVGLPSWPESLSILL